MNRIGVHALLLAMDALGGPVHCAKCGSQSESALTSMGEGWTANKAGFLCPDCAETGPNTEPTGDEVPEVRGG